MSGLEGGQPIKPKGAGMSEERARWLIRAMYAIGTVTLAFVGSFIWHVQSPYHAGMPGKAGEVTAAAVATEQTTIKELTNEVGEVKQELAALRASVTVMQGQVQTASQDTKELAQVINRLAGRFDADAGRWGE